jgi:TPR repeat protein
MQGETLTRRPRRAAARPSPAGWLIAGALFVVGNAPAAPPAQGDAETATRYAEQAAAGDRVAQNNLGVLYQRGQGVGPDPVVAREWFERAAAQGLPGAMYNVGMLYLRGYGVPTDPGLAAGWFEKAAALGDAQAQFYLGMLHYRGQGVTPDPAVAASWFERAAALGVDEAKFNLALMLARGEGVAVDEARALELLAPFSATRDDAALLIGEIHLRHAEDPARAAEAYTVFKRLAEAGVVDAQAALAMLYVSGTGVSADPQEGRFWMEQAARQGSARAQLNLGDFHAQGVGTPRDLAEAWAWYSLSADGGEASAKPLAEAAAAELDASALLRAATRLGELRAKLR